MQDRTELWTQSVSQEDALLGDCDSFDGKHVLGSKDVSGLHEMPSLSKGVWGLGDGSVSSRLMLHMHKALSFDL